MPTHDESLCFCGTDDDCHCHCPKCRKYMANATWIKKRAEVRAKFLKSDMDLSLVADLIWMELEPMIEAKIEKMAKAALTRSIEGMTLHSIVSGGIFK